MGKRTLHKHKDGNSAAVIENGRIVDNVGGLGSKGISDMPDAPDVSEEHGIAEIVAPEANGSVEDTFRIFQSLEDTSSMLKPEIIEAAEDEIHAAATAADYEPDDPFCSDPSVLEEVEPGVYRMEFRVPQAYNHDDIYSNYTIGGLSEIIIDTNDHLVEESSTFYDEEYYKKSTRDVYEANNGFNHPVAGGSYPAGLSPQEAINWHKTPRNIRFGLGTAESRDEAYYLISTKNATPKAALAIAHHPDPGVRYALASSNIKQTPEMQHALLNHTIPNPEQYSQLITTGQAQTQEETLIEASPLFSKSGLSKVQITNPGKYLKDLEKTNSYVRIRVAGKPANTSIVERLKKDPNPAVRNRLADKTKDPELLDALASDTNKGVRRRVASNLRTRPKTLITLGKEKDDNPYGGVSRDAKENPSYPGFFKRLFS